VMDYMPGGELFSRIEELGSLLRSEAQFYMSELIVAMQYIHGRGFIYRDLKPENLMIDPSGHLKLVDFGYAAQFQESCKSKCGTAEYIAPEMLRGEAYTQSIDWWAIGVLLFELLTGSTPFEASTTLETYQKIMLYEISFPDGFDPDAQDMVEHFCVKDPTARWSSPRDNELVCGHAFFAGLDWHQVRQQGLEAPFVPAPDSPTDTKYFEEMEDPEPVSEEEMMIAADQFKVDMFPMFTEISLNLQEEESLE